MPRSTQPGRKRRAEVMPPLSVYDRIDSLLKAQQSYFPNKSELTAEEIAAWHRDLEPFPIAVIEEAFENWRRNARFFPTYADILDLCIAYQPPEIRQRGCSIECRERHGKGYNSNDVLKLWKMYDAKRKEVNGPLKDNEIESLLAELDSKRPGGAPEWRR